MGEGLQEPGAPPAGRHQRGGGANNQSDADIAGGWWVSLNQMRCQLPWSNRFDVGDDLISVMYQISVRQKNG